jgi:nucleoside-diphosphate-sugar epimerase
MKKILITGANGFVGSFLTEEAVARGYEVWVAVRRSSNLKYISYLPINKIEFDFENKEALKTVLSDLKSKAISFDFIIHNAGVTQTKLKMDYYKVNYEGTKCFVEALRETGMVPEKFLYTSSLAAWGPGQNGSTEPVRLSDSPKPLTSYGKSKLKAEQFIASVQDFPYLIFRPTAVYGPRETNLLTVFKTIKKRIEPYIGFKSQYLTFIYVKDLVSLFLDACESSITRKSYFVADGQVYTTEELNQYIKRELNVSTLKIRIPIWLVKGLAVVVEQISSKLGKFSILNGDKVSELESLNWRCDIRSLSTDFNFRAKYDLAAGVKETVAWYKNEAWL